jgi:orotidine-5'-phosphate decarboxylase
LKRSLCFPINMVSKLLLWKVIMCCMEDEDGLPKIKWVIITSEEKYILESLIKLVKSLIIDLMRLIWSCFLVCRPSFLPTHLHPLMS